MRQKLFLFRLTDIVCGKLLKYDVLNTVSSTDCFSKVIFSVSTNSIPVISVKMFLRLYTIAILVYSN